MLARKKNEEDEISKQKKAKTMPRPEKKTNKKRKIK